MKKKILIFSLAYYPSHVSGAEAAIKEITDRIDSEDIEFHLITHLFDREVLREEQIGSVRVHRVGFSSAYISKILFVPFAALKARTLHRQLQFDGMWSMMTYMLLPLVIARFLGVKVPYVHTFQDGDTYEKVFQRLFIRPFTPLIDYGIRNARVIQVISNYLATWPKKRGYKGEVIMVRNGANPKNFEQYYSDEILEETKASLGKKEGDVYLFIAARLEYQKGIDAIIKALPLLPERVSFIIAGDGSEREMLEKRSSELNVENRVVFLGALDRDDVPKYRNTIVSDIFIHPSRSEGLGNSVLSAMAAHLPVIASSVGGLGDFIFDERTQKDREMTAWEVAPDAPNEIATAVTDIMEHKDKVERVVKNARAMVEREYRWDTIAVQMKEDVFHTLWTS